MSEVNTKEEDCGNSSEGEYDKEHLSNTSYPRSIELPAEETFRNLRNAKRFAIDIGMSRNCY